MQSKKVLEEILNRISDVQHDICLYDSVTDENINIDDELKMIIKTYYQDKLALLGIKEN